MRFRNSSNNNNRFFRTSLYEALMNQQNQQQNGLGDGMDNDAEMADDAEMNDDSDDMENAQMEQQGSDDDYEMSQENPDEAMGDEENKMNGTVPYSQNGDVDEIVTNIREQCLQGLQMLANNIQDPAYELLKKMWDMCDKAQTPEDNGEQPQQQR